MGGGGGGSKSKSKSFDMTPLEYRNLRLGIGDTAQYFQPELDNTFGQFLAGGGAEGLTAPMGAEEQAALQKILGYRQPFTGTPSQEMLNATVRGDYLTPDSNPFLSDYISMVQRGVGEQFDEQELLDRAMFSRAGHTLQESSPFSRARAIATRGYANALGDVGTRIAGQSYEAERARQLQAASQIGQLSEAEFGQVQQQLEASALPRLIEEMGIERGQEVFNERMGMVREIFQIAAQLSDVTVGQKSKGMGWTSNLGVGGGTGGASSGQT